MKTSIDVDLVRDTGITKYLELASTEKSILLKETNGSRTIASTVYPFLTHIDTDFGRNDISVGDYRKPETSIEVYTIVRQGGFRDICESFGLYLHDLCLTQHQIIEFLEIYPQWLRERFRRLYFLYRNGDEFPVVEAFWFLWEEKLVIQRVSLGWGVCGVGRLGGFGIVVPQVSYGRPTGSIYLPH
jgi:hypothetical protein